MPTQKKKKRVLRKKKRLSQYLTKGSATITLILAIIIIGAILFVAGPFPNFATIPQTGSDPTQQTFTNPKVSTKSATGDNQELQLKTLDFQACSADATVDMEVDTSGSMACPIGVNSSITPCLPSNKSRIADLKTAVNSFLGNLGDNSLIGIQSFSNINASNVVIPVSYYKDVKGTVESKVNSLRPNGRTPTAQALRFSESVLKAAQAKYPDRKFVFIFVSDGLPVPAAGQAGDQDPRSAVNAPNPADEIKNLGVKIITIAIGNEFGGDQLMKSIASTPQDAYNAPTTEDLANIYQQIGGQICQDAQ
jgi:hypothetical protein